MAVISKDIKAECKSNLLEKKNLTGWEEFSRFSSILKKKLKNLKDKNTNIILVPFMVGISKRIEGFMILTRRIAALCVAIVLCFAHVFLEHVFYTHVIFCIFSSSSM